MTKYTLRAKSTWEEPHVNLTPLIDVVFVILIMFIVIAPLLNIDRVELAPAPLLNEPSPSVHEKSLIGIHVKKDNTILLNEQPIDLDQLKKALADLKKQHAETTPQLFHDREAFFGTYQSVKNALEEAGFEHLDVILKPN